jgi:hypothetical protein
MDEDGRQQSGHRKARQRAVSVTERRARAVSLRASGATYEAIAQELGLGSRSSAYKIVRSALQSLTHEASRELLMLESSRLDALQHAVWSLALGEARPTRIGRRVVDLPPPVGDQLKAVAEARRLSESRRTLFGLNAAPASDSLRRHEVEYFLGKLLDAVDAHVPDDPNLRGEILADWYRRLGINPEHIPGATTHRVQTVRGPDEGEDRWPLGGDQSPSYDA